MQPPRPREGRAEAPTTSSSNGYLVVGQTLIPVPNSAFILGHTFSLVLNGPQGAAVECPSPNPSLPAEEDAIEAMAFLDLHRVAPSRLRKEEHFDCISINGGCAISLPDAPVIGLNRVLGIAWSRIWKRGMIGCAESQEPLPAAEFGHSV